MASLRGFCLSNSITGTATSIAASYSGWTTANPATGDLLAAVVLASNSSAQSITQTAGAGTWTIPSSDGNTGGLAAPFTSAPAWRVMGASDTAPTFGWGTGGRCALLLCAFAPAASWPVNPVDAEAAVLVQPAQATSFPPGAATAAAAGELSVVLSAVMKAATGVAGVTLTNPASYTGAGQGGCAGAVGQRASRTCASFSSPVGAGSVAPGAETTSIASYANVYQFLFAEGGAPASAAPCTLDRQQAAQVASSW